MSFDPDKANFMNLKQPEQPLPEIGVQRRLFVGLYPAARPPALGPSLLHRVDQILGITLKNDRTGALQGRKRLDGRGQLHTVVGGLCGTA